MMRNLFIGIFVLFILLVAGFFFFPKTISDKPVPTVNPSSISSFEECAAAGYPIMESYPEQCNVPGSQTFTRDIGNETEHKDVIQMTNPRPNQAILSPLEISGEARGSWYFEASFSAELLDDNNQSLGVAIVEAQSDWMTENFVPFKASLTFTKSQTKNGTLVVKNANASGLPENDKQLIIPVTFQ